MLGGLFKDTYEGPALTDVGCGGEFRIWEVVLMELLGIRSMGLQLYEWGGTRGVNLRLS